VFRQRTEMLAHHAPGMLKRRTGLTIWQGAVRKIAAMARVIALTHAPVEDWHVELLRSAIVCGCAIALIAAGQVLPF